MIVSIRVLRFSLPEVNGLKEKRSVVRSAVDRARARSLAAIAEVGAMNESRRAIIGVSALSNASAHADALADAAATILKDAPGWVLERERAERLPIGIEDTSILRDDLAWEDFDADDDEQA